MVVRSGSKHWEGWWSESSVRVQSRRISQPWLVLIHPKDGARMTHLQQKEAQEPGHSADTECSKWDGQSEFAMYATGGEARLRNLKFVSVSGDDALEFQHAQAERVVVQAAASVMMCVRVHGGRCRVE